MNWGHIFEVVGVFYFRAGALFFAYLFAKVSTALARSSTKPPVGERLWRYACGLFALSIVAVFLSARWKDVDDDHSYVTSFNWEFGAIAFVAGIFPVLLGVKEGFRSEKPPSDTGGGSIFDHM